MKQKLSKPRIICVGANIESDVALRGLIKKKVNVVSLVTLPSEESDGVSDYVDLHPFCSTNNIKTIDTNDINSTETCLHIKNENPDYIFVLGWSQIFKENLLSIPNEFIVGSHPSPLPEGRGRAPVPWTIIQEKKESAITLFKMSKGVDSGEILVQKYFEVPTNSYASELYNVVAENLRDAFSEIYDNIISNKIEFKVQDLKKSTYRGKRTPSDGFLNFEKSAYDIEKLIRAVSEPYPGAYTYYQNQKITIFRANNDEVTSYHGTKGQILAKKNNAIMVQAGDRPIWLSKFFINGKEVSSKYFKLGEKLGYHLEDELFALKKEISALKKIINDD